MRLVAPAVVALLATVAAITIAFALAGSGETEVDVSHTPMCPQQTPGIELRVGRYAFCEM